MNQSDFIQIILTFVSLGISITAIILSCKQINLSNKHALFDKRLKNYLLFIELLAFYEQSLDFLLIKDYKEYDLDKIFLYLTNSKELRKCRDYFNDINNKDKEIIFYEEIEYLKIESLSAELLWNKTLNYYLSDFIKYYSILLEEILKNKKLKILTDNLFQNGELTKIEYEFQINELKEHENINITLNKLNLIYNKINENNIINKIKEELKVETKKRKE